SRRQALPATACRSRCRTSTHRCPCFLHLYKSRRRPAYCRLWVQGLAHGREWPRLSLPEQSRTPRKIEPFVLSLPKAGSRRLEAGSFFTYLTAFVLTRYTHATQGISRRGHRID